VDKIVYNGKEYKSYKEIWREYELKFDYSSFIVYVKKYGLEAAMDHYLNLTPKEKDKIVYKGKEYKSYKEIWREYGFKCHPSSFTSYVKRYGIEAAIDHCLNTKEKDKIVYKGKEYKSYTEIWKEYELKCIFSNFLLYIKRHGLEKAMDRYLNKDKIVYKGKEYNNYREIWREYGFKCHSTSFTSYVKRYGLEAAMDHYLNKRIIYKGKEYKSYREIWREYELKCDYSGFMSYINKHGLKEAIEYYLNLKEKDTIIYKNKKYNIFSLYNMYKNKIPMSYSTFSAKLKLYLDDIESFMDILLEED